MGMLQETEINRQSKIGLEVAEPTCLKAKQTTDLRSSICSCPFKAFLGVLAISCFLSFFLLQLHNAGPISERFSLESFFDFHEMFVST